MLRSRIRRIALKIKSRWLWRFGRQRSSRVTIVNQFFPPDFAATGQLLDDLTRRLAGAGIQIQILTGMPAYAFNTYNAKRLEFSSNRYIRRTQASRYWPFRIRGRAINSLLFSVRTFIRMLRSSRRGDLIIYTSEPAFLPIIGWLLHSITRTPFIVILYDLYPEVLVELGALSSSSMLIVAWRKMHRWMLLDAKEVIVLSEAMANKTKALLPKPFQNKVSVIPSWADPEAIKPISKSNNWFVQKHNLEERFIVLYSGNQGRCHDLVTCIATASLLRNDKDVLFLFIGNGPQHQRLLDLVEDWGLTNCLFLAYQELEDLPFSLSAADLALVTLSIKAEGLVAPSKLYAHLASSTPIAAVTPSNSYLHHLVEREGIGRWFLNGDSQSLADWILYLKGNYHQRLAYGEAGRKFLLRSATPDLVASKYLDLIRRHMPSGSLACSKDSVS